MTTEHVHHTRVLLDAGAVLFDQAALTHVLCSAVAAVAGLSESDVTDVIKRTGTGLASTNTFLDTCAVAGMTLTVAQRAAVEQAYAGVLADTSAFVFPDVPSFLNWITLSGAALTVVFFGDAEAQHKLLHASGLEAFLPDVRYLSDDTVIAQEMVTAFCAEELDVRVVFISSTAKLLEHAKEQHPEVIAVHVRRDASAVEGEEQPTVENAPLVDHTLPSLVGLPRAVDSCLSCATETHAPSARLS